MAKLSAKVVCPISIKVTTDSVILSCENSKNRYQLENKVKIKGEHYGFTLINFLDDIEYEETFPTQARIRNIELSNGILNIYEQGKHNPWRFNNNGEMLENPTVDSIHRIEIDYPKDSDRDFINVYVKK